MAATFSADEMLAWTLPRKVQSYMAAGKPIAAAIGGETKRVLSAAQCGECCTAEDAEGLAAVIARLANLSPSERADMGSRGKSYCKEHFSKQLFFETLESELQQLKGTKHGV